MRKLLLTSLLLASSTVTAQQYDFKITRVVDGDTVEFEAPFLPEPLPPVLSLRILGVDTPEKGGRAKCSSESVAGEHATEFTKLAIANSRTYRIDISKWDKFGGRVLGDVIIDGKSLHQMLIDNNLAREYHGEAKKSWCGLF